MRALVNLFGQLFRKHRQCVPRVPSGLRIEKLEDHYIPLTVAFHVDVLILSGTITATMERRDTTVYQRSAFSVELPHGVSASLAPHSWLRALAYCQSESLVSDSPTKIASVEQQRTTTREWSSHKNRSGVHGPGVWKGKTILLTRNNRRIIDPALLALRRYCANSLSYAHINVTVDNTGQEIQKMEPATKNYFHHHSRGMSTCSNSSARKAADVAL